MDTFLNHDEQHMMNVCGLSEGGLIDLTKKLLDACNSQPDWGRILEAVLQMKLSKEEWAYLIYVGTKGHLDYMEDVVDRVVKDMGKVQ